MDSKLHEFYTNKNILVTGGTGFIGRNIVHELLKYSVNHIFIFDRTIKYKWKNENITYIGGDLLHNFDRIEAIDFDIVFHEAANVDTTSTDDYNMIQTNYTSFVNLVELCSKKNSKIIYASSAATYGNSPTPNEVGLHENPINIYGKSKLLMDKYVRERKESIPVTVIGLRYFNVYGPGEESKGKMMSMIGQMILRIKDGLDVKLFEFGEQTRDFIYVGDVAKCNLLAGLQTRSDIYNCGYGDKVTFNHIFEIITSFYKNDSKIEYIKQPYSFFQVSTCANITKTSNNLQYYPSFDIYTGIKEYVKQMGVFIEDLQQPL